MKMGKSEKERNKRKICLKRFLFNFGF